MKKEDVIFERKEFLNLPGHHGMANIVAYIVDDKWDKSDKLERDVDIKLDIADCSRVISMSIDDYSKDDRENSLYKVDTLIEVLSDFKKALKKEFKLQDKLEVKREAKKLKEAEAEKKAKNEEKAKKIAKTIIKKLN